MRTTPDNVRALAQIADGVDLTPYVETAATFIDELEKKTSVHTANRLELIERHLAAHLAYAAGILTAASVTSKSIAGASTSYGRLPPGTGLAGSPYGLTAIQLDTTRHLLGIMDGRVEVRFMNGGRDGRASGAF